MKTKLFLILMIFVQVTFGQLQIQNLSWEYEDEQLNVNMSVSDPINNFKPYLVMYHSYNEILDGGDIMMTSFNTGSNTILTSGETFLFNISEEIEWPLIEYIIFQLGSSVDPTGPSDTIAIKIFKKRGTVYVSDINITVNNDIIQFNYDYQNQTTNHLTFNHLVYLSNDSILSEEDELLFNEEEEIGIGETETINSNVTANVTNKYLIFEMKYSLNDPYYCDKKYIYFGQTEIEEIQISKIYPNPTKDIINIPTEINKVLIFDITGKLIQSVTNTNQINLIDYTSGVYFVKGYKDDVLLTEEKIIKL